MLFPGAASSITGLILPWTPVVTPSSGTLTSYNIIENNALRYGQFIHFYIYIQIVTAGTANGAAVFVTLPTATKNFNCFPGAGLTATKDLLRGNVGTGSNVLALGKFDGAGCISNGANLLVQGWYEALL